MSNAPLVSIVIPAYNAEKYLGEAIESVLAQTYQNWEAIIINDGSTDDTERVGKEYEQKDSRVRYFYQENKKMASARNSGIARARGKYIAFLDADNIFFPDKLEIQVDYLEKNPECGVCYGRIQHFYDPDKDILYGNTQPMPSGNIFGSVLHQNFINVLSVLVRKDVFDAHGAFQEGWWACDEQYVWINFSYHGVRFCPIENVLGLERLHRKSDSRRDDYFIRTADRYQDMLDIVESWFDEADRRKYEKDIKELRSKWRRRRVVGLLLANPPTSWVLAPVFRARRDRLYKRIKM